MIELPLFPLPMVMFPRIIVPLHIFEERYKLLINRSIDQSLPFGIVLNTPGASIESASTISRVGVSVKVIRHERIEGGRLNILVAGDRRFEILDFIGSQPYWTATVDFIEDDASDDQLQESFDHVARLFRQVHALASQIQGGTVEEIKIPDSPAELSYMVSHVLDIPWNAKQELLEMSSITGRLKTLSIHLEEVRNRLNAQLMRTPGGRMNGNGRHH